MDVFTRLFGEFLVFVYHCFDRIVIHGYLTALSRPELVVHFFRDVVGVAEVSKEVLSQRTNDYQRWVEAYARNHSIPIEWAEKGVRKEDHVRDYQEFRVRAGHSGKNGDPQCPDAESLLSPTRSSTNCWSGPSIGSRSFASKRGSDQTTRSFQNRRLRPATISNFERLASTAPTGRTRTQFGACFAKPARGPACPISTRTRFETHLCN